MFFLISTPNIVASFLSEHEGPTLHWAGEQSILLNIYA